MMTDLHKIALDRGLRIGYKLVRSDQAGARMVSLLDGFFRSGRSRLYHFGRWTRRKFGCGSLAVFSNPQDADNYRIAFGWSESNTRLLVCLYKESETREFGIGAKRHWISKVAVPLGTDFADCVYPIRAI